MQSIVARTSLPLLLLAAACGSGGSDVPAVTQLTGAGATFPNPIYQKWFDAYNRSTGVQINYQSIGSGGGVRQFTERTVDFGATDGPMTEEQLAAVAGNVVHIPTVLGAVVLTYNVAALGTQPLVLDAATIAGIYLGKITKWNDPSVKALNPSVELPDADLIVVHRSDGSGTSYVFTDYLSKVSEQWLAQVGRATSVNWPTGLGGKGNEGVTQQVKQLPGSIGYVEMVYAISNGLPYAQVRNASGNAVTPTLASVTEAAGSAVLPPDTDFRVSITNPPGTNAYPIASFTWLLVPADGADMATAATIKSFVTWIMTAEAQQMALDLQYAPLPASVVALVTARLGTLMAAGKPIP